MPKIKKIREIPSKVKKIETIDTQEYPENLEEEIEESELEEFAEFVTGVPSSAPGEIVPILGAETAESLEEVSNPEGIDVGTLSTESGGRPLYESEGGTVYESGKVYASDSLNEEAPTYAESTEAPSATIQGSLTREIDTSRQHIGGGSTATTPIQQEGEPDRGYALKEEAEGIKARREGLHRRG